MTESLCMNQSLEVNIVHFNSPSKFSSNRQHQQGDLFRNLHLTFQQYDGNLLRQAASFSACSVQCNILLLVFVRGKAEKNQAVVAASSHTNLLYSIINKVKQSLNQPSLFFGSGWIRTLFGRTQKREQDPILHKLAQRGVLSSKWVKRT